jgi:hypothetical protein
MNETIKFISELEDGLSKMSAGICDEYERLMQRLTQMRSELVASQSSNVATTKPIVNASANVSAKKLASKEKYYEK